MRYVGYGEGFASTQVRTTRNKVAITRASVKRYVTTIDWRMEVAAFVAVFAPAFVWFMI